MTRNSGYQNTTGSDEQDATHDSKAPYSDREAAQAALSMVNQQKKAIAKHLHVPWWQGPLIGLCMALFVVSHAAPTPFNLLVVAVGCFGVFFMLRQYTNQQVWVSGWRKGKTRSLSVVFFTVYLIHYFVSMWLFSRGHNWIIPASATSIFIIAILYGHIWMAVWRKEMEADDVC